jgi:putative ABC transport system permease protein
MGIPILRGRDMALDEYEKDGVVLINEGMADLFWPGEDPIGRDILFCQKKYQVIGIVTNTVQGCVKHVNLPAEKANHIFCPFKSQFPNANMHFVVRTQTDSLAVVRDIRAILRSIDPTTPLYDVGAVKAKMNKTIHEERFTTTFLTIFTVIAMVLIVVGIYGVVSYAAKQRTNEIGIRMALGAGQSRILVMILKHGLILFTVGTVIGIAGSIGLTRFLQSYLFEVSTIDPITFVSIPVFVGFVTLLACYLPARRAAKVDPMEALRYE